VNLGIFITILHCTVDTCLLTAEGTETSLLRKKAEDIAKTLANMNKKGDPQ